MRVTDMAEPKAKKDNDIVIAQWFKVWTRWEEVIDRMTDQQAGRLLKSIMAFVTTQTEPNLDDDDMLATSWAFMKSQIQFDQQKYINQVKHNREAGRTSAKVKAKKRKKQNAKVDEILAILNADGTRDRQQVLTSVNQEEKKRREEERRKEEKKEGLLPFLNADQFDITTDKGYILSRRAMEILERLGERRTFPKMNMVTRFIREHEAMTDEEIMSSVKYKLQDLTETEDDLTGTNP